MQRAYPFLQLPQRRGEKAVHKAEVCQRVTLPYQAWEASESYPEQLVRLDHRRSYGHRPARQIVGGEDVARRHAAAR